MYRKCPEKMDRPKIVLKLSRRSDLFAFDLGHKDMDSFLDASRSRACLTFDEFCFQHQHLRKPKVLTANDYLTLGLNSANDSLRYLPHKREAIESLRRRLSMLTFSKNIEAIRAVIKDLEAIGVRVFWPDQKPDTDMKELYETYLENVRFQEYTNRKNSRIFNSATPEERELM